MEQLQELRIRLRLSEVLLQNAVDAALQNDRVICGNEAYLHCTDNPALRRLLRIVRNSACSDSQNFKSQSKISR